MRLLKKLRVFYAAGFRVENNEVDEVAVGVVDSGGFEEDGAVATLTSEPVISIVPLKKEPGSVLKCGV